LLGKHPFVVTKARRLSWCCAAVLRANTVHHDANAIPFVVCHGCHRGHCLRSLLLPYLPYSHPRSSFSVLSSVSWSGIDPSGRCRGLLIGDGF
jgi:hypothetical protein